ncbi:unnamed protein product [Mytilus coruscus]|uniref:Ig-like domain-containing protein n=1 Tax=Mytilus coruscus TaxID=42192 RepID=A0A6J8CIL7_MYTCO|nr:unnamed protein product [Mytilus coruscus]
MAENLKVLAALEDSDELLLLSLCKEEKGILSGIEVKKLTNEQCQSFFRFDKDDIEILRRALRIPEKVVCSNRTTARELPTNLTIDYETDENTIIGTEDELLKIACNVESGSPPETIYWKQNGRIQQIGGPRRNVFQFRTNRTVHNSTLTCEVVNDITDKPLIKTVRLDIKYKPIVLINREETIPLFEGEKTSLCCEIDSNPHISFMLWLKDSIYITNTMNSSCLFFKHLNRQDKGNYTCLAGNEIGNGSFETTLTVYYPPSVYLENKNFSINESKRVVHCKGDGEPNNITFFRVEHTSYFDEHIRYLAVSPDGIAKLPPMKESKRYQDTGLYLCNASNGILDKKGNIFQRAKAYLVSPGPPVFVAANKKIQYGQVGNPMDITIKVYSTSAIKCLYLNAIGRLSSHLPIKEKTKTVPLKIDFYGVNITANGKELTLSLLKLNSFGSYNVTVCNHFSVNYFIVEVRKTGISQTIENVLYQSQGQPITEHPSPVSTLLPDVSSENTDTLSHNMEEINQSMENRLNYADVVFQQTSRNELRIIGLEDRTVYADVDTSVAAALLPETRCETSSSEDDFVYVDGIENFIEKRETND